MMIATYSAVKNCTAETWTNFDN